MIIGALLNKGDLVRFFLTAGSSIDQKLDVYHHFELNHIAGHMEYRLMLTRTAHILMD